QSGKCVVTNARAASWPSIFIEEIFGSIEALSECLDLIDLVLAQPEIHGADDARDLLRTPHADDCACNHAVSQSPGDRGLARVAVVARGDLFQLVSEFQIARDERLLKLRAAAPPVVFGQIVYSFASHRPGQ